MASKKVRNKIRANFGAALSLIIGWNKLRKKINWIIRLILQMIIFYSQFIEWFYGWLELFQDSVLIWLDSFTLREDLSSEISTIWNGSNLRE